MLNEDEFIFDYDIYKGLGIGTERDVEIPIAQKYVNHIYDTYKGNRTLLEIGNVLQHYDNDVKYTHSVIDKYEKGDGVLNQDIFNIEGNYDHIVSISTIEHVNFWLESSRNVSFPGKAIRKIYDLLKPGGNALISVPFGKFEAHNNFIQFDREYVSQNIFCHNLYNNCQLFFMKRTGYLQWEQEFDINNLSDVCYDKPYQCANAICIIRLFKNVEH
jgi:SAM-dependent methyltransferase